MSAMKDMFGDLPYEPPGRAARNAGIKRVENNSYDWMPLAMAIVEQLPSGWIGTGEDIKLLVTAKIGPPHHFNVVGSIIMQAVRRGYLRKTGLWLQAKGTASHSRNIQEYRRT